MNASLQSRSAGSMPADHDAGPGMWGAVQGWSPGARVLGRGTGTTLRSRGSLVVVVQNQDHTATVGEDTLCASREATPRLHRRKRLICWYLAGPPRSPERGLILPSRGEGFWVVSIQTTSDATTRSLQNACLVRWPGCILLLEWPEAGICPLVILKPGCGWCLLTGNIYLSGCSIL